MSPLDRKLARDLRRMRMQVLAICLVIAVGVLLQVMMSGLVSSLTETRRAYYERNRMADVFVALVRAPRGEITRLGAIAGVRRAEGRVTGAARIDPEGAAEPIQARAISLPSRRETGLNAIHLVEGRRPGAGAAREALLLAGFARANRISVGDRITVTANGTRRNVRVTGLAQAPDQLYVAAPGEIAPDPSRFAVIWMDRTALAGIYGMEGAFNEALLTLSAPAAEAEVIAEVDRLLARWGGAGAYARADLVSDRFVSEEIDGLRTMSRFVPPLFLTVAAFVLYIVVSRMVHAEREEIGLLKSFGYSDPEVGAHYMKFVLAIAVAGAVLGCIMGLAAGRAMVGVYTKFYNFPFLVFRPDPGSFALGVAASVAAASTGGLFVLRRVFALAPAEAMRPPTPPDFSRGLRLRGPLARRLDQPSRMIVRGLARRPLRSALLALGIAAGMALSSGMTTIYVSFEEMMRVNFSVIDRSDVTVAFTHPVHEQAAFELARLPGVIRVEGARDVPVIFRNGARSYRGSLTGLPARPDLRRAVGPDRAPIGLPEEGVVLAASLAEHLGLVPGQSVVAEVRVGRRPVLTLPVAGVAETLLGAPAYMAKPALDHALSEPHRITSASMSVDPERSGEVYVRLKNMPAVAGVSVAEAAQASIERLMDEGAGAARYVMGVIAFVITFGVIYNAARISHDERVRDLAALRVMGFSRAETGFVLLGELGAITLLALPAGSLAGFGIAHAIAEGFSTDIYRIPAGFDPFSHGFAASFVLAAAMVSGWLVKRDLDRTDLVLALKSRD